MNCRLAVFLREIPLGDLNERRCALTLGHRLNDRRRVRTLFYLT